MIKLNDNQLYVGHIKQILKNFNLPLCQIISEKSGISRDDININEHFIEDTNLYLKDKNNEIRRVSSYNYGTKYLNLTSNFQINNMIYDRDTHRYLGRYLRFLRDYKNVDLMSMYNLFDQESFDKKFNIVISEKDKSGEIITKNKATFTSDTEHITYQIPITRKELSLKLFDSSKIISFCVYVDTNDKEENIDTNSIALKTFRQTKISNIFNFDFYNECSNEEKLFIDKHLKNLYLLIKVSKNMNSSIVILEGKNYIGYKAVKDNIYKNKDYKNFKCFPQLFSTENAKSNYLLADRIIEYLSGNVICPLSDYNEINRFHWVEENYRKLFKLNWQPDRIYGTWTDIDSNNVKEFITTNLDKITNQYDLLGYVDKDVEILIRKELDDAVF